MKPLNTQINLKVVNNTALPQPVSILGVVANSNTANNNNILYSWNLATENYLGSYVVTIYISNTSNLTPVYYSIPLPDNNIQSVVTALNSLNQGLFEYDGTTIYVSNNYYIYGALEVVSTVFTSVWNTNNTSGGSSASNQVQLPLEATGSYNFVVDWGDGSQNTITVWNQAQTLHTYSTSGTYTINITGTINGFVFNNTGDRNKLISISNWGTLNLGNSGNYFNGCTNLNLSSAVGVLDLTGTIDLTSMFLNCSSLTTINNVNQWNVSNVLDMTQMFSDCVLFNDDLSNWDVSSVIKMNSMFQNTIFNSDISSWDVSSVGDFISMFSNNSVFNQPLNSWDVSSGTNMSGMFSLAVSFNQPLNSWDVSSVVNMSNMFAFASAFNQSLSSWDVSNVTNMSFMFRSATSFNQVINGWNVSSVTDMQSMFRQATNFNQKLGLWDISNVTNFTNFMLGKTNLNYSANNLDDIYNDWSLLSVQPSIVISFGTIKYTIVGQAGRNILTGVPNNWTITDGGI
jgi:surface protein